MAVAAWLGAGLAGPAAAEDAPAGPLKLRVGPSGYEATPRETLAEKIARRERESDYQLRWICRGCLPAEIEARANSLRPTPPGPSPVPALETPGQ